MNSLALKVFNIFVALLFVVCSFFFFSGCAGKERVITQTVYKDVLIPVPCDVPEPQAPGRQENVVFAVIELRDYAERLKLALGACKGVKN